MASEILEELRGLIPQSLLNELKEKTKGLTVDERERVVVEAIRGYIKALLDSGEAVGIVTAQSIGEPSTQMILRSFHYAGLREFSMALGLPRMIEIVDAKREPSTPMMFIYLKDEYGRDRNKAVEVAKKLQLTTLESIAKSVEVDYISYSIVVEIDVEQLKYRGLTMRDVERVISKVKGNGVRTHVEDNTVVVTLEESDIVKLRKLRDKMLQTRIAGVKNIRKTLVRCSREEEREGERVCAEWMIVTEGSNLEAVLKEEEVDHTRTISNNIHEVAEVLGIEAARVVIMNEIKRVLDDQGLDVDIRHPMLVADAMTWDGRVRQIGRHGVAGKKDSPLARAAFEVTVRNLVEAALRGEEEKFRGVVENIIAGKFVPVGTGLVRLLVEHSA